MAELAKGRKGRETAVPYKGHPGGLAGGCVVVPSGICANQPAAFCHLSVDGGRVSRSIHGAEKVPHISERKERVRLEIGTRHHANAILSLILILDGATDILFPPMFER